MAKPNTHNQQVFAFIVNDDKYFLSHRLPIGLELLMRGFKVHVIVGACNEKEKLKELGFIIHLIKISRIGKKHFREMDVLFNMHNVLIDIITNTLNILYN